MARIVADFAAKVRQTAAPNAWELAAVVPEVARGAGRAALGDVRDARGLAVAAARVVARDARGPVVLAAQELAAAPVVPVAVVGPVVLAGLVLAAANDDWRWNFKI